MTQNTLLVNASAMGTTAPLQNVSLCMALMQQLKDRPEHLPGIGVLSGFSGYGKSMAAAYTANKFRAHYIECKSAWTRKSLLMALMKEMGLSAQGTIPDMVEQISEELALSMRPLIIDEVDHIVKKSMIEIVRDIYEGSNSPILLIGEENLPNKLKKWERVHNRVLKFQLAQPANDNDAQLLARLFSPEITIDDALMNRILQASRHAPRRICVNIHLVSEAAKNAGLTKITAAHWGDEELYTGEAPRRVAV